MHLEECNYFLTTRTISFILCLAMSTSPLLRAHDHIPSFGKKFCQCSPDCTSTLNQGSRWRYHRGHSPKGKLTRLNNSHGTVKSFVSDIQTAYTATIAQAKREIAVLSGEIDRLEGQAVQSELTAKAARDQVSKLVDRHALLSGIVEGLELVTSEAPA